MFREKFEKPSVPKTEQPSEEELEVARKAFQEADPTQFTALAIDEPIRDLGLADTAKSNRLYTTTDEYYVGLLPDRKPKAQRVLSMLVKGIVPVADIVRHIPTGTIHSKVMPLERIQANTTEAQLRAYIDFMYLVFGDEDRREHGDLQHNYEHVGEKAILYDFGNFDLTTIPLTTAPQNRRYQTLESLTELVNELNAFHTRIEGEQGRDFLKAVLASSDIAPKDLYQVSYGETTIEDLHEQLLARTNRALLIAQNERRALEGAEA